MKNFNRAVMIMLLMLTTLPAAFALSEQTKKNNRSECEKQPRAFHIAFHATEKISGKQKKLQQKRPYRTGLFKTST